MNEFNLGDKVRYYPWIDEEYFIEGVVNGTKVDDNGLMYYKVRLKDTFADQLILNDEDLDLFLRGING